MPVYLPSYRGSFTNRFQPPNTLNQVSQFLQRVDSDHWETIRKHTRELAKNPRGTKIKPSSYKRIYETKTPHKLIPHVIREHRDHANHHRDFHIGGGIHEGVSNVLTTLSQSIGGEAASKWVEPVFQQKTLDDEQVDMAELLSGTYQDKRVEHFENFMRIPEFDTRYGSLFVDTHGTYTWSVRGTKGNFRDIFADVKIMAGSTGTRDSELVESFQKFKEKYPNAKPNVAGHSLGTELMFNAADETGLNVREFFAFNPASSPAMPNSHIRKNLERKNAEFFLNSNDPVSKTYLQLANQSESDRVYLGGFLRSPLASHKLGQWVNNKDSGNI